MELAFQDKTVAITGGANGIGRCIAEEFAARGAWVFVLDVDKNAGEELASRLKQVRFVPGDAAKQEDLEHFAAQIQAHGSLHYLINNACVSHGGILSGCGYEDFVKTLRLGVAAPYWLCRLLLPSFAPGAAVVNISSTRAHMSQADTESYTAAKGGISALTHGLAASLAGRARVNAVSPGWIDTWAYHQGTPKPRYAPGDEAQHAVGRVGTPQDIAAAVLFLCSDQAGFITGQEIVVDGGMTKRMIYSGDEGWQYRP